MGSRSEGPDKNSDAEGNLTSAGVAANKAAKQKQKAEAAAANSLGGANGTGLQAGDAYAGLSANLNAAGSNQNFNQQLGQNYLDSYNDLKGQKKKSKNQLQQLANMNQQMGYNPTQGMGIMGSLNYNTIGAGADIANLMNNPLVKIAGMAINPAMFAGGQFLKNAYGAYADEDDDTGFFNAAGNTLQDVTPFDTSRVTDFLGNLKMDNTSATNAGYVGSDVINTVDPLTPVRRYDSIPDEETSTTSYNPFSPQFSYSDAFSNMFSPYQEGGRVGMSDGGDITDSAIKALAQEMSFDFSKAGGSNYPYSIRDKDYVDPLKELGMEIVRSATQGKAEGGRVGYNEGGIAALLNLSGNVGRSGGENYDSFEANPSISMNDLELYANITGDKDEQLLNEIGAAYELADDLSLNVGINPNKPQEFSEPEDTLFARITKSFNQGGLTAPLSGPMPNGIGGLFKPIS